GEQDNPVLIEDETRPPPRYRPHTLIRAMKDAGIGRPSTYSRTVEKLEERAYVQLEDGTLVPTEAGRAVWTDVAPLYADEADADHDEVELFSPEFTALMEERLDLIERGEVSAPESWEEWRDQVRELHAIAQERKKAGAILPNQQHRLERLLANAPEDMDVPRGAELAGLSQQEARELIQRLQDAGVKPAPTEKQLDYIDQLVADLELDDDALEALTGVRDPGAIRTTEQASAVIDELKRTYDERKPPSAKQRRFIAGLMEEVGMSEEEAAALVGAGSLDELTGGKDGTASALIDALQERVAGAKAT
ncbi:MAG: DNA topoisomerase, partial [Gemmatimonadota bacterium]